MAVVELPHAGIGVAPARLDGLDRGLGRPPVIDVQVIGAGGGGEEEERLAEGVELELLIDPVADLVGPAGVAAEAGRLRSSGTAPPLTVPPTSGMARLQAASVAAQAIAA